MASREGATEILGVFRDEGSARAAADAVRRAVPAGGQPRVGAAGDSVTSLKAEMREELDNSFAGAGNVGPFTKEMTKGIVLGTIVGAIAGFLLTIPIGLIAWESIGLGQRLLIAALVGAFGGATMGFVAGGGFGAKDSSEKLAAERGVTVAVEFDSEEDAARAAEVMRQHDPVRVDVTGADGHPAATLTTEEDEAP